MPKPKMTQSDDRDEDADIETPPAGDGGEEGGGERKLVDLRETVQDDDEGDEGRGGKEGGRETRADKKAARGGKYREAEERAKAAEERAAAVERQLESERDARRREVDQILARLPQPGGGQKDPIEAEIEATQREMSQVGRLVTGDDAKDAEVHGRYLALGQKLNRLIARAEARAAIAEREREAGGAEEVARQVARRQLQGEYPWLADEKWERKAIAQYQHLVHNEDRPPGPATEREACALIAAKHSLGGRATPPRREDRGGYETVPGRSRGGGEDKRFQVDREELEGLLQGSGISEKDVLRDIEREQRELAARRRFG